MLILMSTCNIQVMNKLETFPNISLNICFSELSEKFPRENKFESAMVNRPLVFELLKFYCVLYTVNVQKFRTLYAIFFCLNFAFYAVVS